MGFKSENAHEKRCSESKRILAKYPDLVPLICERLQTSKVPEIDKKKYLVPHDLTMGQFLYVIRKRIKISSEMALFVMINGKMSPSSHLVSQVYNDHKDDDGFLYVTYSGENTFG